MLKEKYNLYKNDYKEYILIIKSGNFYISINNDATIMNKIFKYKIIQTTNLIKIGFPINSLNKVLTELDNKTINYVVIDNEIIEKQKQKNNQYSKYLTSYDKYQIYISRINKINEILKDNLTNKNISQIINNIESILCKINY